MPLLQGADGPQGGPHGQQLRQPQPASGLGPAQGVGHVLQPVEGGRAKLGHEHKGGVGLLQQVPGLGGGVHRLDGPGQFRRIGAGGLLCHHL